MKLAGSTTSNPPQAAESFAVDLSVDASTHAHGNFEAADLRGETRICVNPWLKPIANLRTVVYKASSKAHAQRATPGAFPAHERHRDEAR